MDHNIPRNVREMEAIEKEQMEIEVNYYAQVYYLMDVYVTVFV